MQAKRELLGLQALRGLAALLVVAHHTAGTLARAKYGGHELAGGLLFPLGRAGVDLFFVLSGFIIYYIHRADIARPARFGNYAVRRLSRIYPTFWLALAFIIIAIFVAGGWERLGDQPAVLIAESALLMPFTPPGPENVVGVAWTLSHELLFYAVFGLLILSRRAGIIVLIVWLAALLGARPFAPLTPPFTFLLYIKNIEFFMGMGIAWLLCETSYRAGWKTMFTGLALFVATAVIELLGGYDFLTTSPTLGYGLGAAAMIFALASIETSRPVFRVRRPFVLFGAASYSIYLIHFTVVVALVKVAHAAGLTGRPELLPVFLAIMTIAVLVGVFTYLAAERRLIRFAHRISMGRARASLGDVRAVGTLQITETDTAASERSPALLARLAEN